MAHYRIAKSIGRGGMGQVLLAVQQGIGGFQKLVVIKKLHAEQGEDEGAVAMFLDEARIVASLSHPNVVQILDIGREADGPFIAMEYLAGETLSYLTRALTAERRIPIPILCRIFSDVARGLHHAHTAVDPSGASRGIVHRDVSPSNIIVCFNGVTKIVDFGVAKSAENARKTLAGTVKGKLSYLAPEQIQSPDVDGRADVFQLGIVLHEVLTRRQLFEVKDLVSAIKALTGQEIHAPSTLEENIPAELDAVVMHALERDRDKRFPDAEAMAQALEAVAEKHGGLASPALVASWIRELIPARLAKREQVEREVLLDTPPPRSMTPPPIFSSASEERRRPTPPPLPLAPSAPGKAVPAADAPPEAAPTSVRRSLQPRGWTMGLLTSVVSGVVTAGLVLLVSHAFGDDAPRERNPLTPVELDEPLPPPLLAYPPLAAGQDWLVRGPASGMTTSASSTLTTAEPAAAPRSEGVVQQTAGRRPLRVVPSVAPVPQQWLAPPKFPAGAAPSHW